jgi:hypothetical protein
MENNDSIDCGTGGKGQVINWDDAPQDATHYSGFIAFWMGQRFLKVSGNELFYRHGQGWVLCENLPMAITALNGAIERPEK